MSVMNEAAIGLGDLLTQGNKMIAAWREALNDLEALLYLIERKSGQRGEQVPLEDDSIVPFEMKEEKPAVTEKEVPDDRPARKRTATLEEARKVMSAKCKAGYRAEVKALLSRHGLEALSQAKDPELLSLLMEEAEGL